MEGGLAALLSQHAPNMHKPVWTKPLLPGSRNKRTPGSAADAENCTTVELKPVHHNSLKASGLVAAELECQ